MNACPVRVVKVGGSLFDLPDLACRLRQWLSRQSPAHHLLLAGGGPLADQVRQWHALSPLEEAVAHWMCVDLLTVSAHLLHARLPEIPLIEDDRLLCQRVGIRGCTIFEPAGWMRHGEPKLPGTCLPPTWEVTSDSIAARLAVVLGAEELVLMKSTLPKGLSQNRLGGIQRPKKSARPNSLETCSKNGLDGGIRAFSAAGYVDPMLTRLVEELPPIRLVNLRAKSYTELVLHALGSDS